jgi:hypothetical protein
MSLPFNYFDVSPSGRTPNPINLHPHEPCSHCFSPYHSLGDCLHWRQFSNFSNEQLNTSFSSLAFESNSNFYNPDWSNHFDFSWHDHAMKNFSPQVDELQNPEYLQFNNQFSSHSSYDYPPKQSSLEETLKEFLELVGQPIIPASHELSLEETLEEFRKTINQSCQEIIDATVANTEAVAMLEGQFGHLVFEFNRIEEEEFQNQEMARGQYMIDEDCPSDPHHEHVQATTTFESEEVVEEIFCEPSLEDPLEKSFAQFEFDLDIDMIHEQAKALLDPTPEMRTENGEEEMEEQIEPPPILNWSNNKEVSTEVHSLITIPLETLHVPQASFFQCLEEPSYVEIFKVSRIDRCKYRNRHTKKIFRRKQICYIRWWNILPEGYQILKKKGWKGLVGHPYERERCSIFSFLFSALHFFIYFLLILFSVILFYFFSISNSN